MEKLGDYVDRLMKEKGLTKVDVENRSGNKIADSHVANIVKGKTKNLTIDKINALAEGLGVDSVELFKIASGLPAKRVKGEPWPANILLQVVGKIVNNPDLTKIVQAIVIMKPAKVKAILKIVESEKE